MQSSEALGAGRHPLLHHTRFVTELRYRVKTQSQVTESQSQDTESQSQVTESIQSHRVMTLSHRFKTQSHRVKSQNNRVKPHNHRVNSQRRDMLAICVKRRDVCLGYIETLGYVLGIHWNVELCTCNMVQYTNLW